MLPPHLVVIMRDPENVGLNQGPQGLTAVVYALAIRNPGDTYSVLDRSMEDCSPRIVQPFPARTSLAGPTPSRSAGDGKREGAP
jgi:hypothetical protein